MNETPEDRYQFRARVGVGASIGMITGAGLATLFSGTTQDALIGLALGAGLGAAVGSQLRSKAFQFLWIEYPKEIAFRLLFAGLIFLVPFLGFLILLKGDASPLPITLSMFSAVAGGVYLIIAIGNVIAGLDDLLKKINTEAIALGFGLSLIFFLSFGIISLAFPIPANWLIAFIIMLVAMLLGRFLVAVKYR